MLLKNKVSDFMEFLTKYTKRLGASISRFFKRQNAWRLAFYTILLVNLLFILSLSIFLVLTPPVSDELPVPTYMETESGATFTVETTKADLNRLINDYLDEVLVSENTAFNVWIDEDVNLSGSIMAFGVAIPLTVTMDPIVMPNGDLVLQMDQLSLGLLNLPRGQILHYFNRQVETPEWLYFDSQNERIYISVTEIALGNNFQMSIQSLDLSDDEIEFIFNIPRRRSPQAIE